MTAQFQHQFTSLAPYYDELMSHVPYSSWVDYVLKLCKRYKHSPKQILDCACGTGNVTYELASRGFDVVGVDFSQEMIDVARRKSTFNASIPERSRREQFRNIFTSTPLSDRVVEFVHSDLCNMELGRQFDTVTCLYDSNVAECV